MTESLNEIGARQPRDMGDAGAAAWLAAFEHALFDALRQGREVEAGAVAARACARWPDCARLHWLHALLLLEGQAHGPALVAVERAAVLDGADRAVAALRAQIRYEHGQDAADAFAAARAVAPDDPALARGHAGALAARGEGALALALLDAMLATRPDWGEGLTYRATLHRLTGAAGRDDIGFARAVAARPRDPALRLAWFHWLAKARDWDVAGRVLDDAEQACGASRALSIARLFLIAETGAGDGRPDLFDALGESADPGLTLARVRHALRCGAPDRAVALALPMTQRPGAALFWPYLSIAWRLLGDDRAAWLDRPGDLIRAIDLSLSAQEMAALAALLRTLHGAAAPYPDQSVRGGTQTDRPLLFRHERVIASVRAAIDAAVRAYVEALPPVEPGHPLLGTPRGERRFAGSWSVLLRAQGYHAAHSHPAGWISSALHVALPPADAMGPAPAGWLQFGTPPPELTVALPPYGAIAPRVGQLILFPSTLWHGTVPFDDGERLSIAFDVQVPRR